MNIPINIETLLTGKVVESERIEFKKGWNPSAIMRTVAAFANDFENLGSGYIVVGIEEDNGMPKRPVYGFPPEQFDQLQKEMIGYCNLIYPPYFPRLSLEEIDGKYVVLIWATAGSHRPYEVPKDILAKHKEKEYYIRKYSSTIKVNAEQKQELFSLAAKVPFDDRVNTSVGVDELNYALMREHLFETGSKLFADSTSMSAIEVAGYLNLTQGPPELLLPKNVGLLMFTENPKKYFSGAQIDIVEFPEGVGSKQFNEKIFEGPIQKQLKNAISYIKASVVKNKVVKHSDRAEADNFANYPMEAIEETLSNAVYHRDYELPNPIEVRILPESIEIISYSGVDPSLKQADFDSGKVRSRRYRNRRIGEFLKELQLTEGRETGIPTIKNALVRNGSGPAIFDTDEPRRSYFYVEIPIHPAFLVPETEEAEQEKSSGKSSEKSWVIIKQKLGDRLGDKLGKNEWKILELIYEDDTISIVRMADILGISTTAIENNINKLKNRMLIERIGSPHGGKWQINE